MSSSKIIAVDLDGTLTFTDTLHEAVLGLARLKPFMLLMLPFWLIKGVAHFKFKVSESSALNVTTLPYNYPLIDWLKSEKGNGAKIVLCTAANERIAQAVSDYLGLFDDVIASDAYTNLKGDNKSRALQEKFGEQSYDYAGDNHSDVKVWANASQAIVVNANARVRGEASQVASVSQTFSSRNSGISDWMLALRFHQWLKNLLLFVPLLAAHQFSNFESLYILAVAFISFSFCASFGYIINDLLDLESDRNHPSKRHRPFASARLTIASGVLCALILICISISLAVTVGRDFLFILLGYLLLTIAYWLVLKRVAVVDCLALATFYTVRIIAGAAAVSISISFWLLAFSIFIFLSLAFVKRYAELVGQIQEGKQVQYGRAYVVSDHTLLQILGISSGYISTLVIGLYIRSEEVVTFYAQPTAIWLAIPILLFWVSWVWLKATRGEMHHDPIVFAATDRASLVTAALTTAVFIYATIGMAFIGKDFG